MVQKKINNKVLLFALLVILSIAIAVFSGVISEDIEAWCKQFFGPAYSLYLFGIIIVGSVVLIFLTTDFAKKVFPDTKKFTQKKFGIQPTLANQTLLKDAKAAISQNANTERALQLLSSIRSNSLDVEIALLNARLVEESRTRHQGIASYDEISRTFNRITKDTLYFIRELEKELSNEEVEGVTIRTYLQNRYSFRLSQKLSGRQPVNLKYIPSIEGTSEETSLYYVFKGDKEIQKGISQVFREANGRLLIIGEPGAGKTTLLLQLALDLLKNEGNDIPVIINLLTWKKEFISIETWLAEILPAELGITKRSVMELVEQNRLILILDGFDEIKEEDRTACLEAIGEYSVIGIRRFVISSRKAEFIHILKDAPVYAQIEIRPLTVEQIIEALDKVGYDQPEAKPLILALQKDKLLGEVAQTPFYFNLLQLLYAGGKRPSDFNFHSTDVVNRRKEVLEYFILRGLSPKQPGDYTEKQLQRWLAFFASRLKLKNLVTFELTNLQYDWWIWPRWRLIFPMFVFHFASSTLAGFALLSSILFSLFFKSLIPIGLYIFILFLFSIMTTTTEKKLPHISTTEKFKLSFENFPMPFLKRFFLLNALGSLFPFSVTVVTLMYNKIITSWFFKDTSLSSLDILFWGFIVGGFFFILIFIIRILLTSHSVTINIVNPYDRFILSSKWLHFSILQHKVLCLQLWIRGLLPYNLIFFLKKMSNRHILEFNGSSWRFQHRLIQDYFVSIWDLQYQESPKLKLNDAEEYQKLAQSLRGQNNMDEAIENFQKTIQLNPNKSEAYNSLGNAYYYRYEDEKAIDFYKKAVQISPKDVAYHYNIGIIYYQMGQYDEAITWFKKAIQIKPKFHEAHNYLGNAYFSLNKFSDAAQSFQKATRLQPKNAVYHYNMGFSNYKEKKHEEAITNFQKATQLDIEYNEAYNNLGNTFYDLGKFDKAIECYQKAAQIEPSFETYYTNIGLALNAQKKYDEAIQLYEQVINKNPKFVIAYLNLGHLYQALGKMEEAVDCFQKSIELEPENPNNYYFLADVYYDQNKLDYAIENYRKAIQLSPDNALFNFNLSAILMDQNKMKEAFAFLTKSVQLNPNYMEAWVNLSWWYLKHRNFEEAKKAYKKLQELGDSILDRPKRYLGHIELMTNNLKEAMNNYKESVKLAEDKNLFFEKMKTNFTDLEMVDFISNIAYEEILAQLQTSITSEETPE